jgi:ubiquinone biosynthesis protein COQ4
MRSELAAVGITTPWGFLRAARNLVRTVWDPTNSEIQNGINALVYGALREAPPERVRELEREAPELAALFAEGYDPELSRERLARLPDGSLGREYLRFIETNRIDPLGSLLALKRPSNLLEYSFRRAYKLHDLLHVVLGCDASVQGEVQIVSWSLGQARRGAGRAPALALAVLIFHLALRRPEEVAAAVRLAAQWLERGRAARPYSSFRLEDWLELPVAQVRERVTAPCAP